MNAMKEIKFNTEYGEKTLAVFAGDITEFKERIDILTMSAFYGAYDPTPNTLFACLAEKGISVAQLAKEPEIDLRSLCKVWISKEIFSPALNICRIGCVEMSDYGRKLTGEDAEEENVYSALRAYFYMLHLVAEAGMRVENIVLPILGGGSQKIPAELTVIPILNQCVNFLKTCAQAKNIYIVDFNQASAFKAATALDNSYSLFNERERVNTKTLSKEGRIFISYSSADKDIAAALAQILENFGKKVWYAPRDIISRDYASAIVRAITDATHFVVILSKNSIKSQHVLNEVDLAFGELKRNIKIMPLIIDENKLPPSFLYYLSRQQWSDAKNPPIEQRLMEFAEKFNEED